MAQTFTHLLTHVIFSTKERRPLLKVESRPRLFSYRGGIMRSLGAKAVIINGTSDHVHLLEGQGVSRAKSPNWVGQTLHIGKTEIKRTQTAEYSPSTERSGSPLQKDEATSASLGMIPWLAAKEKTLLGGAAYHCLAGTLLQ